MYDLQFLKFFIRIINDHVLHENNIFSDYIRSMYFILQTLFTIGYGDVSPVNDIEILFTLFLILNGSSCVVDS